MQAGFAGVSERLAAAEPADDAWATGLVGDHFDFVFRVLRRFGLAPADAEDACQQVFLAASGYRQKIAPGKERAFLFGTAMRVAAKARRGFFRRREEALECAEDQIDDAALNPEQLVAQRRAQQALDSILASMKDEVRAVFVLYELEGMTAAEVAECLTVAPGTVASRLRRGREVFARGVKRLRAREGGSHG